MEFNTHNIWRVTVILLFFIVSLYTIYRSFVKKLESTDNKFSALFNSIKDYVANFVAELIARYFIIFILMLPILGAVYLYRIFADF